MKCRLCDRENVKLLIDFKQQPIIHHLHKIPNITPEKYPFKVGLCSKCNFIQLIDTINPNILYQNYFTLSSWKNQPHIDRLIEVMIEITGINHNSTIFEIGCNDGMFLEKLKKIGFNNISAIEPTKDAFDKTKEKNLTVDNHFFTNDYVKEYHKQNTFDIVITRHVLEHIINLDDFIKSIEYILKDDGKLIIEIPNSSCNIDMLDYALWEEHVNYFTYDTLEKLVNKYQFRIIHHEVTLFSGVSLIIFCEKINKKINNITLNKLEYKKINHYASIYDTFKEHLHNFLSSQTKPIAIYGCGARSCTFVNFLDIAQFIEIFIDDQEEKQNLYVPMCDIQILPWDNKYINYTILLGVNNENEHKVIQKRNLDIKNTYSILQPSSLIPTFWKDIIYNKSFILPLISE
jgi:2-polyprenyl-3-methyl-5-hydroxy-6-metoxy-1,4-benzoquinol methylase